MKRLIILALLLVLFTGCASVANPDDISSPPGAITKYNGEYESYFIKCRASNYSGGSSDKSYLFNTYDISGFDFDNKIELDDNSLPPINNNSSVECKWFQTSSHYFDADFYEIVGNAKIVNTRNHHNSKIISNGLMRSVYDTRSAEDEAYWFSANDLNGDGFEDILVAPTYNKPQYEVRMCTLYDGKTLEEIEFLDKNLFIKDSDKVQIIEYLKTNPSQLAAWFTNLIHITDEEYPGNVRMEPSFVVADGENCIALKFVKMTSPYLGELYIVYNYKEEGMTLKYILLNTREVSVDVNDEE